MLKGTVTPSCLLSFSCSSITVEREIGKEIDVSVGAGGATGSGSDFAGEGAGAGGAASLMLLRSRWDNFSIFLDKSDG